MGTSPMNTGETPTNAGSPAPPARRGKGMMIAAIVVVVVVIVAGVLVYEYYLKPKPSGSNSNAMFEMGGFNNGQVVTFLYNGTNTFQCTPPITTFFPNATSAAAKTPCEVGAADQNAVSGQVPQWILVPAFAGLSIFGVTSLGASAHGFPMFNGQVLLTQCGAGATNTSCIDHPTLLYSPDFAAVEQHATGNTNGIGGLPFGVLPTPAHDHLLDISSVPFSNVPWGIVVVLVFDPNIWPSRDTAACSSIVSSNLSSPTANCLSTFSGLQNALTTKSTAVNVANNGTTPNPIWQTLGSPLTQVVVPGVTTVSGLTTLNGNLYIPFAVLAGPPPMEPT